MYLYVHIASDPLITVKEFSIVFFKYSLPEGLRGVDHIVQHFCHFDALTYYYDYTITTVAKCSQS